MVHKAFDYFKLARIEHGILAGLVVVASYLLNGGKSLLAALLLFASTLFSEVFLFVTNDIYNIEEDRVNRPNAPLVSGRIGVKEARIFAILSFIIAVITAFYGVLTHVLSSPCLLVLLTALIIGFSYNARLKRVLLVNNLIVAFVTSLTFLYGMASVPRPTHFWLTLILFLTSFLASFGREVVKTIADVEGDRRAGIRTISIVLGVKCATYVACLTILGAIILSTFAIYVAFNMRYSPVLASGILVTDFILAYACLKLVKTGPKFAYSFKNIALIAISITIIAFIVFSLLEFMA